MHNANDRQEEPSGTGLAFAIIFIFAALAAGPGFSADKTKGHFPVSVWYAGGKARAPMLETVTTGSRGRLAEGPRTDQEPGLQYRPTLDRMDGLREGRGQVRLQRPEDYLRPGE